MSLRHHVTEESGRPDVTGMLAPAGTDARISPQETSADYVAIFKLITG